MSYTTDTIEAFANLLSAVKELQPDHSEAQKLASKLITDNANAKQTAIGAIEGMKYKAYLDAQAKGNAYAIEMLSQVDPVAPTKERAYREMGKGGILDDGTQLPFDKLQVLSDANEYFDTVALNQEKDSANAMKYLMYTGMNKDSDASKQLLSEATADLKSMMEYREGLYDKSETLQNISDGQDNLWDLMPIVGSRKEIKLDKKIDNIIDKQQALVDMLSSDA